MKDKRIKFSWIQTSRTGRSSAVKCKKPLKHNPQFEGKIHCKACAREAKQDAYEYLGGEEE